MRMGWANDAREALWRWKRDVALPLGQGMAVVHAPQGLFMAGIRTHASRSDRTAWHESISDRIHRPHNFINSLRSYLVTQSVLA